MLALLLSAVVAQTTPTPSPTLSVSPLSVQLNPAQERVVQVSGAAPPLTLTLDQRIVNVTSSGDGTITIEATQQIGADTLHIADANGATADVAIRVAFNAGTIVPQATLNVTGNPAQPDWLADVVTKWVTGLTQAMPGATVTIASVTPPPAPLAPGASAQFVVPVQVGGSAQYFDQSGTTTVTVQNTELSPFDPVLLFYDDDPEHVDTDGVLFRATVSATQPARLYYYHDAASDPRRLVVALQNTGAAPSSVQLLAATAGPNMDVMQVGESVSRRFLLAKSAQESVVFDLANRPFFMTDLLMTSRQLVAGTADLRVLSGGPVQMTVLAVSPGVDPQTLLNGPVLPGDGHHRTGVFSIAGFGDDRLTYTVGGDDATAVLGDTEPTPPSVEPSATGRDYGDYGVVHTLDVAMSNPSDAPATVYLFMQPLAGPARGTFLVNGNPLDVGCVRVPSRYQVTAFDLTPGATSHAVVQTMTDGGSFYPVRVGVTTTAPIPSAPPITAPDGCFPKAQPDASQ